MKTPVVKSREGLPWAIAAFILWGILPIFWKTLDGISTELLLLHRTTQAAILLGLYLLFTKKFPSLLQALKEKKQCLILAAGTLFIALNWFFYVWAVNGGHIVESSLAYFCSPIFKVFLGQVFLKERLNLAQKIAVYTITLALGVLLLYSSSDLFIVVAVGGTFPIYALIHKFVKMDPFSALFVETATISILGSLFFSEYWLAHPSLSIDSNTLVFLAGLVTILPLLLFHLALRKLGLGVIGMIQYIGPALQLITGVYLYNEQVPAYKVVALLLILMSVIFYIWGHLILKKLFNTKKPPLVPVK